MKNAARKRVQSQACLELCRARAVSTKSICFRLKNEAHSSRLQMKNPCVARKWVAQGFVFLSLSESFLKVFSESFWVFSLLKNEVLKKGALGGRWDE